MLMNRLNRTAATSAIPIGMPGWPEFAFWTESIARTRIASAIVASTGLAAAIVSIVSSLFTAISSLRGALLALHELQDQRGQDELHGEIQLVARHHDRIGARHERVLDHRKKVGKIDAAGIGE